MQIVSIGVAAGAASALLFASFASGSLLSIPLFYLAPLPILIAALGWNHIAAAIAATIAALALALIFGGFFFVSFLIGIGLPAWWLGYLALLARPVANGGGENLEWYPVGRLVAWAAILSACVVSLVMLTIATEAETLRTTLQRAFEPLFRGQTRMPRMLLEYPHLVLPPAAGVLTTMISVFDLWLAGRVVRTSGRLRRPWPDIAALSFPPAILPVFAAALVGSLVLSGMAGILATVLTAALLTAFGLLGLAVLHTLTRAINGRGLVLGAVYGAIAVFGWPLLLMALLGISDSLLDLRGRAARRGPPPPLNP